MTLQYEGPEGWGDTAYTGDAGIDIPIVDMQVLEPGEFYDLPSGIKVAIPEGYYARIAARSGALRNKRIRVYEGVIDAGYRGELFTYCEAIGPTATVVRPGDRLAQLIIQPVIHFPTERMEKLPPSERGTRGFGSSDQKGVLFAGTMDSFLDRVTGSIEVYLGGPIDYQDPGPRDERIALLRERIPNVEWFDPRIEAQGIADPGTIWDLNMRAMRRAGLVVFLFPDPPQYGFGSPIEITEALRWNKPIVVFHNSEQVGVYMRKLWQDGLIVATDWRDFLRVLGEEIAKVRRG